MSRLSHYSVESQPRISHQPKVNISELDAQLEQIKEKNRRYKPSLTQKCVDFEEEGERASYKSPYIKNPPRAFRLGEAGNGDYDCELDNKNPYDGHNNNNNNRNKYDRNVVATVDDGKMMTRDDWV